MLAKEKYVFTHIALQPFMEECLVLHECAEGRMHINVWQDTGLNCKPDVVGFGAGLGQAVTKTNSCPDMSKVIDGA